MPPRHPNTDAEIDRWTRLLLGSTSENAVIVLTTDGTIVAWLGAAALLFGYGEDEAVGMPLSRLFTPEDVERQLDRQERELALSAGRSEDDRWHVRKDESRFWGSGVMEPIRNQAGATVALAKVLRDRTDVRTQVVALRNRLLAAEDENLRRLHALASLTHELRNQVSPLTTLLATVEKVAGVSAPVGVMRRQLDVMHRLLDDLAQAAAVVALKPTLAVRRVEVQTLLLDVAASLDGKIVERGQVLKVTLPETVIVMEADPHRVDQILVNLLSNACKYTPRGGSIQLSATVEDDLVAIRVEDDGDGIPQELLPKIFDLFTREGGAGAPEGLGVGLSVVKNLVELHGGFVEGRSAGRGKGSIFTVRLPLTRPTVASDVSS